MESLTAQELYAQLYDVYVSDWPGEVEFYRDLIAHSPWIAHGVLEIACGTGRIALRFAQGGVKITGLDISSELLAKVQEKSSGMSNVKWIQGDMRTFEIGTKFGCVIMPGHSFQILCTPDEQMQCLDHIRRHLVNGGLLVLHLDHQDFGWLAGLLGRREPEIKKGPPLIHPLTREKFRKSYTWMFEPSTQTATTEIQWEKVDDDGNVLQSWAIEPMRLHCAFPFEMEHLLRRAGFSIEAVYGDFFKGELTDQSEQMIWVANNAGDTPSESHGET